MAATSGGYETVGLSLGRWNLSGLRVKDHRLCALVIIGMNAQGEKHFLAFKDRVRESTQSWREILVKLKTRGLQAPVVAIGDEGMGFCAAREEIFPTTQLQPC